MSITKKEAIMKKLLPILCVLSACSMSNSSTSTKQKETNNAKQSTPMYTVYEYETDAVICDKSKKGNFTYCDLEGDKITGFMKSGNNMVSYYENGDQMNGIIVTPDGKNVKTFFKKNKADDVFTVINYYADGSIKSKEITDKKKGKKEKQFNQGTKFNKYYDQGQINALIEVYNN